MLAHASLLFGACVYKRLRSLLRLRACAFAMFHFAASALMISYRRFVESYVYNDICASAHKAATYYAFT